MTIRKKFSTLLKFNHWKKNRNEIEDFCAKVVSNDSSGNKAKQTISRCYLYMKQDMNALFPLLILKKKGFK